MKLKECAKSKHHGAYPADEECPWCEKGTPDLLHDWLEDTFLQRPYRNVIGSDGALQRHFVFGEDEG